MTIKTAVNLEKQTIATIRTLAMDAAEKAGSGHPGTPMGLAPAGYVLWRKFLKFNPDDPEWPNRDRFILSNGHASLLLYSLLHLTGFRVGLEDLKKYRQWDSITPGHPEHGLTPGVDTTTGPLGQGIMNAVGMAMAEAHLAATYNRPGFNVFDHFTYVFCSDGDLMEGASHEAASLAGHFGLAKLICLYDDNHITIEGDTEITYSDAVASRFAGYHWHVQNLGDRAEDTGALERAFEEARSEKDRPSLIIVRSHIAQGSPNKQDTKEAHGAPLGEDEVRLTKREFDWPEDAEFLVPEEVRRHMKEGGDRGRGEYAAWNDQMSKYRDSFRPEADELSSALFHRTPPDWHLGIPTFDPSDGPMATRAASHKIINFISERIPWLIGGSGDLRPSTKTGIEKSGYFGRGHYQHRNIAWGVREHVMAAASSGMALHGGVRPFASTFFVFSDYARPAVRLSALMKLPVIFVFTHDSIGLGGDGPTHQPVEHLVSFRAMPNMTVIRPADANETAHAWIAAIENTGGPTQIILTRQKLPVLDRARLGPAEHLRRGAYVIAKEEGDLPDVILIASGSEVAPTLEAKDLLREQNINARVVSFPSWELFERQPADYRDSVLTPGIANRLAVEAGSPVGWCRWIGDRGAVVGVERFGASAPGSENMKRHGFSPDSISERAKQLIENNKNNREKK